ncbi:DUF1802 family protein [Oculatella sp. FACHB-28]|uniref:DUF1802 family protein n=1 Tax=Oculatella sp. FACHB-28 TaxID=2692845 RepID=UPI001686D620|nr:DUF1802 family protein [Oculatella sp. FACHB-28]MBD2059784.1 DUF1802 family protein [Oculatella sp. FACHB-28]
MSIQIFKGIQLPALDLEMLNLGKLIAIPFKQSVSEGQVFWLYPSQQLPSDLTLEQYYKPEYLSFASRSLQKSAIAPVQMPTWGQCEYHWQIHSNNKHLLPKIAQSTIWNLSALEHLFGQHNVLKMLFLRVHYFSEPCVVNSLLQSGYFFWTQAEDKITTPNEHDTSVVSKVGFDRRKNLLMSGEIYPYTSLESLQLQVEEVATDNPNASQLNHNLKQLLGWTSHNKLESKEPEWMSKIAILGDRSKEAEGTSNYQAGTDFENIVRQSLEFLGFKIDYSHRGGAGGLDLFCSAPYPLVGECKSGKKIPNDTAVQLLNLGTIRLENKETFSKAAKLIIGPGEPTDQLQKAAKVHGMAIIHPTTLEKLVKLHHKYPIDLFKLKDYLIDGQADDEVERYIHQNLQAAKLRAYIIQLVKNFLENSLDEDADIAQLHAVYVVSKPPQPLKREEMYEILVELSSPLTGYLGRRKGDVGSDRFYFLRHMPEIVDQ